MHLHLVDTNLAVIEAFKKYFPSEVLITHGKFEDIKDYDCLVSAANSFGIMDGGIDLAIKNHFGQQLQDKVQEVISNTYFGEQPVGTSFIVSTGNSEHPWLAHSPTMTMPMDISRTLNVYHAMLATLQAVQRFNNSAEELQEPLIETVVCCGLGTLTGKMTEDNAAFLMSAAYGNFLQNQNHSHKKVGVILKINK